MTKDRTHHAVEENPATDAVALLERALAQLRQTAEIIAKLLPPLQANVRDVGAIAKLVVQAVREKEAKAKPEGPGFATPT
jgi:hypothetical protein